jgi:acetyltransferase-like isoleucine patch superfamily enzyme
MTQRPHPRSHGSGEFQLADLKRHGDNVVFEPGALVFHPQTISLGSDVYVGHYAILKGYHKNEMILGSDVWIGQSCFLHSAGGIRIGDHVGIAPHVRILTSTHEEAGRQPVIFGGLEFAEVVIEDGCDLGVGTVILPGVTVGEGSIVGAGAVVTRDVAPYSVYAGVPARKLRDRNE